VSRRRGTAVPAPAPTAPAVAVSGDGAATHVLVSDLGVRRAERWLFRGLTLCVPRGAFVAIVGPSGAGKSTLLACLAGALTPDEGTIRLRDRAGRLDAPQDCRPRIGCVFQRFLLVENSTVLANVLCGRLGRHPWWRTLFRAPRTEREAAFAIVADLGLAAHTHRWVAEVSGGEQQRTAIARALFQEPELYLADEPVSNLDTYLTGRVLGRLRQEAAHHGRTVFCVLHDPDLVDRFADLVVSIDPTDPHGWRVRPARR
jgi:phosphonate transport system ATP-binding protein